MASKDVPDKTGRDQPPAGDFRCLLHEPRLRVSLKRSKIENRKPEVRQETPEGILLRRGFGSPPERADHERDDRKRGNLDCAAQDTAAGSDRSVRRVASRLVQEVNHERAQAK